MRPEVRLHVHAPRHARGDRAAQRVDAGRGVARGEAHLQTPQCLARVLTARRRPRGLCGLLLTLPSLGDLASYKVLFTGLDCRGRAEAIEPASSVRCRTRTCARLILVWLLFGMTAHDSSHVVRALPNSCAST